MSTLAEAQTRTALQSRLTRLHANSERKWGRMNAHQMVCHLNDAFALAKGEKHASPAMNILSRTLVKWVALRTPMQWPHGVKTRPEMEQGVGGTPPGDWDRDCAELRGRIGEFADCSKYSVHPMFGEMSRRDWHTWGFRHVDHHFRQFGI